MWKGFVVAGSVGGVGLWFHSMAGFALARLRFPGREAIFLAIFSTFLVSLPVIIVPLFILVRQMGMVNTYAGLIVPAIFNAFGIFLLRQFYIAIPNELQEAAVIDGASYFRIYWNIMLPLSRPILAALAVFFFLANWNAFIWPLTITKDRKSTRLNSSHQIISYAVFCLKKKIEKHAPRLHCKSDLIQHSLVGTFLAASPYLSF